MKKLFTCLLILISAGAFSQANPPADENGLITLEEFIAKTKSQNESIKNVESINVMVNDLLIENLSEYKIDPKNISKMEILVLEPKASQRSTKPSIIITTKRK